MGDTCTDVVFVTELFEQQQRKVTNLLCDLTEIVHDEEFNLPIGVRLGIERAMQALDDTDKLVGRLVEQYARMRAGHREKRRRLEAELGELRSARHQPAGPE